MKASRTAVVILVSCLSSLVPLTAFAQDDAVTMQARTRFKEGVDAYDKGQFENARLAFLQAYALKKHPAVLLNLAQSSARSGHSLEAAKYFQQFLKESTKASPQQRADAENGLAEVRQKLGRIEIVASAGTEITMDEKERLGSAPFNDPIDVEPGPHSVRSSSETVRVNVNAGQKLQARFSGASQPIAPVPVEPLELTPISSPPNEPNIGTPPSSVDTDGKRTNLLTPPATMTPVFIGLGVAGVGLVSAIAFAAFKADAQSTADTGANEIRTEAAQRGISAVGVCNSENATTQKDFGNACTNLKQNNDKVDTNATIANVSIVVMVVGLATAAGWYLFAPKRDRSKVVDNLPRSRSAGAPSAPAFTPYAGYGNGGFVLSGSF